MISLTEIGWAAGFLEGEGSFYYSGATTYVVAVQKQREPLERLQRLFGGSIHMMWPKENGVSRWQVTGPTARGLMFTIFAIMSPRRREQIKAALAPWRASPRKFTTAKKRVAA